MDKVDFHTFLELHSVNYKNKINLGHIQLYIKYVASLRFASMAAQERIQDNKVWDILQRKEQEILSVIGCGLDTIVPQQLGSYVALLFAMLKYEDCFQQTFTSHHLFTKKDFFKQNILFEGASKIKTYMMPPTVAPVNAIKFCLNLCELQGKPTLRLWQVCGYGEDINHQKAETRGLFQFYIKERYKNCFCLCVQQTLFGVQNNFCIFLCKISTVD